MPSSPARPDSRRCPLSPGCEVTEHIDDIIRILTGLASLGAVIMGIINSRKIKEVHISINSRMDQMLQMRGEASKAEGVAQERNDNLQKG